jgi:hypothetical protein
LTTDSRVTFYQHGGNLQEAGLHEALIKMGFDQKELQKKRQGQDSNLRARRHPLYLE